MSILRSRVLVAGEPTVGKTQLISQITKGNFNHNYMMTQGCEYSVKDIILEKEHSTVELHLLDIAGQNIFKEISYELLSKANMVALVYDATNQDSFHALRQWLETIKQQNGGKSLPGIVIANKVDMEGRIQVNAQDAA
jgi:small GTP-binding protein